MRTLLVLVVLATCGPVSAQSTGTSLPPDTRTHSLPFGSTGNVVELEVATPEATPVPGYEVAVTAAPTWIRFHADRVGTHIEANTPVGRLRFDVDRSAPIGELAEVTLEVRLDGAAVATHAVRLAVAAPAELALGAPYPNPSRSGATVPFEVPEAGSATVSVFDALGREVAVVFEGEVAPGAHEARVPAGLPAGVYVVRLLAGPEGLVRRLTVVR